MIKDTYKLDGFNQVKLPKLKGHVKITLHNPTTGKNEVIEGDNIVTNAVRDIFASNYLGCVNYEACFPLWQKWYGGVLVYKYAHDTDGNGDLDPNDYYPKNSVDNPVIAHAGPTAPSDTSDDITRGAPNTVVQTITDGSVTQGWEWGTNQGNGQISALSLTHKDTGNCGLGSTSQAFANFQPLANIKSSQLPTATDDLRFGIATQYDDNHGLMYLIGADGEYASNLTGFNNGTNKVTVYIRGLPYLKAGLLETLTSNTAQQTTFTVTTTTTWYLQPAYWFDYANKKLWLFSNLTGGYNSGFPYSTTVMKYVVIDCVNKTVESEGTITSDTSNLNRITQQARGIVYMLMTFPNIVKQGNYVYLPTGTPSDTHPGGYCNITGYKKINISNQSDQAQITNNSNQARIKMGMAGNIIIMGDRVLNGTTGYSCSDILGNIDYGEFMPSSPNKPSSLIWQSTSIQGQYFTPTQKARNILANKMVNTTLYNLPSTVTKTSAQSMTITYTLTEVSS